MKKEFLIELTKKIYHLTLLFPKKEPLRYKMRELADDILADSINNQHPVLVKEDLNTFRRSSESVRNSLVQLIEKDLEILDSFFEVAKSQNWVSPKEILNLQKEYSKLKEGLKREEKPKPQEVYRGQTPANQRQEKILEFLKENGRAQVRELKQIFPEVTKRTLRRDFEFLLKQGKIERMGERNETFYQLSTNYESKRITNNGRTMS